MPAREVLVGGAAAPDSGAPGLDAILTVPNVITAIRLACIPVFVWLLFGAERQTAAAILLGALGATDWVDGFVARRFHQVTTLGKVLDPIADRLLVGTAVIAVMIHGAVPVWFGIATLGREVLVGGTTLVLAALGARRMDVSWVGKAGTLGLMFAYPSFLVSYGPATWQMAWRDFAWVAGIAGLSLAWTAAFLYIAPARAALAEGRAARRAEHRSAPESQGAPA
jgi:cardiolipin synthase (CMP-forming)